MLTGNEFGDLMPHIIKVTKPAGYDDYGKENSGPESREYHCLIDDSTTTVRNVAGEEVTVSLVAYVWAVPADSMDGIPVDIESDEKIEIISPRPQIRPLVGIERHYYPENGISILHNITLRFS